MADQSSSPIRPEIINRLQREATSALAMLAGMQLDVFTPLKDGPMTLEQIAATLGVQPTKLRPLIYVLVGAGLLSVDGNLFSNTPEADHFLIKGGPAYMGNLQVRLAMQWRDILQTAESIRTGLPQARLNFSAGSQDDLEKFLRNIQPSAMLSGYELADRWDFSSCGTLADIGGGSGGLAIAISEKCPYINATVIDLPTVTPITQRIVEEAGASDKVSVVAADAVAGPIPGSYDVAVLRSLIQVLSPGDALSVLRNVHEAVKPGGAVHLIGWMLDNSRLTPPSAVTFSLSAINLYDDGQAYTEQEYADWLVEAGFEGFQRSSLSGGFDLVTVRKPA